MRALATTLLVMAAVAVAPAFAPTAVAQLPPGLDGPLPEPSPLPLPGLPADPGDILPPLPPLPGVELPLPAPTPVPPPPPPAANAGAATPPASARGGSTDPAGGASTRRAARTRTAPPAAAPRRAARRAGRRSAAAAPGRRAATRPIATTRTAVRAAATPTPTPKPARRPGAASRLADDVGELVRAIPPAILWALLGIGAIALYLAGNSYWQSRQRARLEAQRAVLLDDLGLLSRALLPDVPEGLDGLAVSAAYRPADGPAAGGDFYDVFAFGEERIGVLLGDVSGHGRESVTQAALSRYTLRTLLAAGHQPGDALARADALLAPDLAPNFVTVIAGVYDSASGELTYAKAGHPPPIVLGAAHFPEAELPVPPLGLGVGDAWPEYRLRLTAGATVCLFTDGLEDARVPGGRLGREEVTRLLAAQDVPDAGRLLGEIEELADRLSDDTAAVVLRRR